MVTRGTGDREGVNARVFIGNEREKAFWAEVDRAKVENGPMVSPGGAAAHVGCSRQYITQLVAKGKVRIWLFKRRANGNAVYGFVPISDLDAYLKEHPRGTPVDSGKTLAKFQSDVLG